MHETVSKKGKPWFAEEDTSTHSIPVESAYNVRKHDLAICIDQLDKVAVVP